MPDENGTSKGLRKAKLIITLIVSCFILTGMAVGTVWQVGNKVAVIDTTEKDLATLKKEFYLHEKKQIKSMTKIEWSLEELLKERGIQIPDSLKKKSYELNLRGNK